MLKPADFTPERIDTTEAQIHRHHSFETLTQAELEANRRDDLQRQRFQTCREYLANTIQQLADIGVSGRYLNHLLRHIQQKSGRTSNPV